MSITLFPFLYAMANVIALTAVVSSAICMFYLKKRSLYPHIFGLFSFYLIDAIIVFQLECSPDFNAWYDRGFVYNPALKTVIFMGSALFVLLIFNDLFQRKVTRGQIVCFVLLGVYFLTLPLVGLNHTMAWFYFTAYQVFTLYWALYGLKLTRDMEDGRRKKRVRLLMLMTIAFSFFIALEDGIVIFNYDSYDVGGVVIHIRNISEDLIRLFYSVVFLFGYLRDVFRETPTAESVRVEVEASRDQEAVAEAEEPDVMQQLPDAVEEFKTMKFAQELALTSRELEVFKEMIAGKSNQQISEELCISMGTVKAHVHNIFQKAGVTHRYELMRKFDAYDLT